MTQQQNDYAQGPPKVNCPNGHPCNQYVTTCRICGAPVPQNNSYSPPPATVSSYPPVPAPAPTVYRGPLPTVATTILITIFFGIFGLIPASMHTSRAREVGQPTNKYWAAFGWTAAASILLWILFFTVIASSMHSSSYYYYP